MRQLVSLITGSRAYGTDVVGSDTDIKCVHVPDRSSILLQRVQASVRLPHVDHESYALHRFLELVAEGQPIALEMLFTPSDLLIGEPSSVWKDIVSSRDHLTTSKSTFVRYSNRQATASGDRAIRMRSLRSLLNVFVEALENHPEGVRVSKLLSKIDDLDLPGISSVTDPARPSQPVLAVGDKRFGGATPASDVKVAVEAALARFGGRTMRTDANGGTDWKSMMHALRLAEEGYEYHTTGIITLPRPNAVRLRAIRLGKVAIEEVTHAIEEASELAIVAESRSILQPEADPDFIDAIVIQAYGAEAQDNRDEIASPSPLLP